MNSSKANILTLPHMSFLEKQSRAEGKRDLVLQLLASIEVFSTVTILARLIGVSPSSSNTHMPMDRGKVVAHGTLVSTLGKLRRIRRASAAVFAPFTPTTSKYRKEVCVMPTITDRFLLKIGLLQAPSQTQQAMKLGSDGNNDLLIPRYPPIDFGISVYTPEVLLERNQDIVDALKQSISNQQLFDDFYFPAMLRLANMVQLLPASETHHHRKKGGLLRHSLEVGLWAVLLAEGKQNLDEVIQQRGSAIEPHLKLAVFLSGICHDLGKVITDILVTDISKTLKWSPFSQGIYDWAIHSKVENYLLHWQEGRGKRHTALSSSFINSVMDKGTLIWLSDGGMNEISWLLESLNNNISATNKIHDFVVAADQLSVREYLKSMGMWGIKSGKSPVALQHAGSTVKINPTHTTLQSEAPQNILSTALEKGHGAVKFSDVPQHNTSAPDKSPLKLQDSNSTWQGKEVKPQLPIETIQPISHKAVKFSFAQTAGVIKNRKVKFDGRIEILCPSPDGLPTVRDFDLLIYCAQQHKKLHKKGVEGDIIDFKLTVNEYLKATRRGIGGAQYQAVLQGLERLRGSKIISVVLEDATPIALNSKLIAHSTSLDSVGNLTTVRLSIFNQTFRLFSNRVVQFITSEYFDSKYYSLKPLQRVLYWLAIANCEAGCSLSASFEKLHWLSGVISTQRNFKGAVLEVINQPLLEYHISLDETGSKVIFTHARKA